jgi:hypothetical protein
MRGAPAFRVIVSYRREPGISLVRERQMTEDERDDVAAVIEDLLAIAKVAMPDDLLAVDPRVIRAEALLAKRQGRLQ